MLRFRLMSRLGLVEPLVRWQRSVEQGGSVPRTPVDRDAASPFRASPSARAG